MVIVKIITGDEGEYAQVNCNDNSVTLETVELVTQKTCRTLKFLDDGSLRWMFLEVRDGRVFLPTDHDDDRLYRPHVTTAITPPVQPVTSIQRAQQSLGQASGLAPRISSVFGSNSRPPAFSPTETAAYSSSTAPGELRVNIRSKTNSRKRKSDATAIKHRRVVFMSYDTFPARYSQSCKILEADVDLCNTESEDDVYQKLLDLCHRAAEREGDTSYLFQDVQRSQLQLLTMERKVLEIPMLSGPLTGSRLCSWGGQGRIYINLRPAEVLPSIAPSHRQRSRDSAFGPSSRWRTSHEERCRPAPRRRRTSRSSSPEVCEDARSPRGLESYQGQAMRERSESPDDQPGGPCVPHPHEPQRQPQPSTSRPEPRPSTSRPEPRPSTSRPEPRPSTSRQTEYEGRASLLDDRMAFAPVLYMEYMGGLSEEDALRLAYERSCVDVNEDDLGSGERTSPDDVDDEVVQGLVGAHADRVVKGAARRIIISRRSVWQSAFHHFKKRPTTGARQRESKTGMIQVEFLNLLPGDDDGSTEEEETGVDAGGLRREFFRLILHSAVRDSGLLTGSENGGYYFRSNATAHFEGRYYAFGSMVATSIVQGGQPPALFVRSLADYIVGLPFVYEEDALDELEEGMATSLRKIQASGSEEEFQEILEDCCQWRLDIDGLAGRLHMTDVERLCHIAVESTILHRPHAMISQFMDGLTTYGVLDDLLREHRLSKLLRFARKSTTGDELLKLLKPVYSVRNPVLKEKEQLVMTNLQHFVRNTEDKTLEDVVPEDATLSDGYTAEEIQMMTSMTPGHILALITGSSTTPVIGYKPRPCIRFIHEAAQKCFRANTCVAELTVCVNDRAITPEGFARELLTLIMNGQEFTAA